MQVSSSNIVSNIYQQLADLETYYPGFENWYWTRVVPGLADQSRAMFVHEQRGYFSVVIAKRTRNERKLCTIRTARNLSGNGLAKTLIAEAIAWVGCPNPLVTVPEERLSEFKSIFSHFDFSLQEIAESYYRPNHREFVFNGTIVNNQGYRLPQPRSYFDRQHAPADTGFPTPAHAL